MKIDKFILFLFISLNIYSANFIQTEIEYDYDHIELYNKIRYKDLDIAVKRDFGDDNNRLILDYYVQAVREIDKRSFFRLSFQGLGELNSNEYNKDENFIKLKPEIKHTYFYNRDFIFINKINLELGDYTDENEVEDNLFFGGYKYSFLARPLNYDYEIGFYLKTKGYFLEDREDKELSFSFYKKFENIKFYIAKIFYDTNNSWLETVEDDYASDGKDIIYDLYLPLEENQQMQKLVVNIYSDIINKKRELLTLGVNYKNYDYEYNYDYIDDYEQCELYFKYYKDLEDEIVDRLYIKNYYDIINHENDIIIGIKKYF